MQKNKYGLLGAGLIAILVGLGLYWKATSPSGEAAPSDASASLTQSDAPQPNSAEAEKPADAPAAQPTPDSQADGAASPASEKAETPKAPVEAASDSKAESKEAGEQASQSTPEPATAPVFDLLRVEPKGSVVIAGKASPQSDIEVVAGATVVGTAKAGDNGDFAVVLNEPLKPGDHQLVLRATGGGKVATSAETAIVSVPGNQGGEVLALVEAPGQASRLITRPEKAAPQPDADNSDAAKPDTASSEPVKADQNAPISVTAVEIEDDTVFVAGQAKTGSRVLVHANEILIGSSSIAPDGRFLIEAKKQLPVGDYIIRADLLDKADRVIATARVPFHREEGAKLSAVAPAEKSDAGHDGAQDAAALEQAEGSVIIRKGDNLWTISRRTYGRGARYTTIYLANQDQIRNPDLILPGQVFTMPKEPLSPEEAERRLRGSLH